MLPEISVKVFLLDFEWTDPLNKAEALSSDTMSPLKKKNEEKSFSTLQVVLSQLRVEQVRDTLVYDMHT